VRKLGSLRDTIPSPCTQPCASSRSWRVSPHLVRHSATNHFRSVGGHKRLQLVKYDHLKVVGARMLKPSIQLHSPNEMATLLASRIRTERLRREWKQETLAVRSGVSLPTLRRYERTGRTALENLLKLCHFFTSYL